LRVSSSLFPTGLSGALYYALGKAGLPCLLIACYSYFLRCGGSINC
jgi:hypothetical protein